MYDSSGCVSTQSSAKSELGKQSLWSPPPRVWYNQNNPNMGLQVMALQINGLVILLKPVLTSQSGDLNIRFPQAIPLFEYFITFPICLFQRS